MISGEQLKTILYSIHHTLLPDEMLDDEDRELVELLERTHKDLYPPVKVDLQLGTFAIDDLPF